MSKTHLAVFSKGWIDLILDKEKPIEARFSKVKCAPFQKVSVGDIVYMKESSGDVLGCFHVSQVDSYSDLTENDIIRIYVDVVEDVFCEPHHIHEGIPDKWMEAKYTTLIYISNPIRFEMPFKIQKSDSRAWVVMGEDVDIKTFFSCQSNKDN